MSISKQLYDNECHSFFTSLLRLGSMRPTLALTGFNRMVAEFRVNTYYQIHTHYEHAGKRDRAFKIQNRNVE